jgi:hypothetical protein
VFLQLYTQEEFTDIQQLCANFGMTPAVVDECLRGMSAKGVNLITAYRDKTAYVRLDPHFREEQAKHNIVLMRLA